MPELPEVEAVCRTMRRVLQGKKIVSAEIAPDEIVLSKIPPEAVQAALVGRTVAAVGRKGKFWWLELDEKPFVFGHLGMSGWVRELGSPGVRLHSHGDAPLDDSDGRPRFLKMLLETEDGGRIAFTDGRRLGRLWLSPGHEEDPQVRRLGPDVYEALPSPDALHDLLRKRKSPIKALLLNQELFAGVGNWIADEVLYHARIAPTRHGATLSLEEVANLHAALRKVLDHAVEVEADYRRFPETWLFHHRWGGSRGTESIDGQPIQRDTVGGRTTAWVPTVQR